MALSDVFDLNPLGSRGFCGVKGPQRGGERRKKDIVVEILVVVVRYSKARRHHRWAPKRDGGGTRSPCVECDYQCNCPILITDRASSRPMRVIVGNALPKNTSRVIQSLGLQCVVNTYTSKYHRNSRLIQSYIYSHGGGSGQPPGRMCKGDRRNRSRETR